MEIIKVYYPDDSELKDFEFAVNAFYCKTAFLASLAFKLNCLFVTCSKYGSRQFKPYNYKSFSISYYSVYYYRKNLNFVYLTFGDRTGKPWSVSAIKRLYETEDKQKLYF